ELVAAPGPDRAVPAEREAVVLARRDRPYLGEAGHQHGGSRHPSCAPHADLALLVVTPGPDAAIALEREAVVPARGHLDDVLEGRNPDRAVAGRELSVAQRAEPPQPPGPDRSVARD